MTRQAYETGIAWIEHHGLKKLVIGLNRCISVVTGFLYAVICFMHLWKQEWSVLWIIVLIPAASFLLLTVIRKKINAKRPYEVYEFVPLLPKDTKGKSFPSRHVFSIFVIGTTLLWWHPLVSAGILGMGVLLAVLRVLTGVHFPKDVLAGAICGILGGILANVISMI